MSKYYLQHVHIPDEHDFLFGKKVIDDLHPLCFSRTQKLAIRDATRIIEDLDVNEKDVLMLLDEKMREVYRFQ